MTLSSLLKDESVEARVLTFPKGHCWSSAMGFIQSKDGSTKVFVKDRDEEESQVQVAGSLWGQEFSKAFQLLPVVAPCESIERPSLESLKVGTPGHKLWKLKEEKWEKEFGSEGEEKKQEETSLSDDEEDKPPPSEFDCWLLEEAILYNNNNNNNNNNCCSSSQSATKGASDVDTSLRRKLRAAADRSPTGCLDLLTVLMLTEYTQAYLATDPEWASYREYGLLKNSKDALTQEETHLMLNEKLKGVHFEVAVLYAIAFALPDVNVENVAIQEVDDGPSNWSLRLVHFDTGVLPVSAGVSLESLGVLLTDGTPFDFLGKKDCTGYFMPVLFSLPAVNQPLQASTLDGLKKVSAGRLQSIAVKQFSNSDAEGDNLEGIGEIVKARIESMQRYASAHPKCTLQDIAFNTISAWKRDFPDYEEENESAEWIEETLEWAEG